MWSVLEGLRRAARRRDRDDRSGGRPPEPGLAPSMLDARAARSPVGAGRAPLATGRYRRGPHVSSVAHDHATVLMDGARYFTLNEVSTRVWQLLEQPRSLDEIVAAICAEYDAPAEAVRHDAEELLQELVRLKLVTR